MLAQIKAGYNSTKPRKVVYLLYQHTKFTKKKLKKFNQVIIVIGVHIGDRKLVKTTGHRSLHFDLPKDAEINLNHEIYFHKT